MMIHAERGKRWNVVVITSFLIALLLALFVPGRSAFAEKAGSEYQIKAAFLLKFLEFIEFSPTADSPSLQEICIIGSNPFGDNLQRLAALRASGREGVKVSHRQLSDPLTSCKVLFLSRSEEDQIEAVLNKVDGQELVTVSDIEGFALRGGMIEFVMEGRSIKFIINQQRARENGVRISSQLLALAKEVLPEKEDQ